MPQAITWCYREWQPLYTEVLQCLPHMTFVHGIQIPEVETSHLIVLDDQMVDATKNSDVTNLYTVGSHHRNLSVVCLLQNLFYHGKENRTMNLNSQYLVLFKNPRDQQQMACLARQMYPGNSGYFMGKYQQATALPYGCLVVDLKQETPEGERLKPGNCQSPSPVTLPCRPVMTSPTTLPCRPVMTSPTTLPGCPVMTSPTPPSRPACTNARKQVEILSESDIDSEMASQTWCSSCGMSFQSPYFMTRHPCQSDSDDDDVSTSSDDDNTCWTDFVDEAYRKHDKVYGQKMQALEDEGSSRKEADEDVTEQLKHRYVKSLADIYKKFLTKMHAMKKNSAHKEILNMIAWYEGRGYAFEDAIRKALRRKRHVFEEILEWAEEDEEEEMDAEDDDGDDDDDDDDDHDHDDDDDDDDHDDDDDEEEEEEEEVEEG